MVAPCSQRRALIGVDDRRVDVVRRQQCLEIVVGDDRALLAVDHERVFVTERRPRVERHHMLPVIGDIRRAREC